ncbi:MAG: hypothetical protein ACXVJI_11365 [Mucilaginibacter sp.]
MKLKIPDDILMNYVDSDVLVHSLVNQNLNLHLKVNDILEGMIVEKSFCISWLSIQEIGLVLAKLNQPLPFILSKLDALMSALPIQYGQHCPFNTVS